MSSSNLYAVSALAQYDIDHILLAIARHGYKRIALQFHDEQLQDCVSVYQALEERAPEGVSFFITADSTWGCSLDDISAMHSDCDFLVYFGSDLSSSSSIPLLVAPPRKLLDINNAISSIMPHIDNFLELQPVVTQLFNRNVLILYEFSYFQQLDTFAAALSAALPSGVAVHVARAPSIACSADWSPLGLSSDCQLSLSDVTRKRETATSMEAQESHSSTKVATTNGKDGYDEDVIILGLRCERSLLEQRQERNGLKGDGEKDVNIEIDAKEGTACDALLIFLGDKQEQVDVVLLKLSNHRLIWHSPEKNETQSMVGSSTRQYRERYGGISRVEGAQTVGIIVGSMGLSGHLLRSTLTRLEDFIRCAGKKSYVFVMGRLNVAKLCNFPEVDIYCLIANEEQSYIKAKTFHVPVVTPFELEMGLGVRDWDSSYSADLERLQQSTEGSMVAARRRIRAKFFPDEPVLDELADEGNVQPQAHAQAQALVAVPAGAVLGSEEVNKGKVDQGIVVALPTHEARHPQQQQQMVQFESAAGLFLQGREYRGLDPVLSADQLADTRILPGQHGIAAAYSYDHHTPLLAPLPPSPSPSPLPSELSQLTESTLPITLPPRPSPATTAGGVKSVAAAVEDPSEGYSAAAAAAGAVAGAAGCGCDSRNRPADFVGKGDGSSYSSSSSSSSGGEESSDGRCSRGGCCRGDR